MENNWNLLFWRIMHMHLRLMSLFDPERCLFLLVLKCPVNTLRPRQNGRHFVNSIFKCISLNKNQGTCIFIRISLKYAPRIATMKPWFRWWLGAKQASHYLNQCWPSLLMHICVTRHQWVNNKSALISGNGLALSQETFQYLIQSGPTVTSLI